MGLDIKKLAEQRRSELENRQKSAIARWKPYIDVVEAHLKSMGRELFEYQKANIAQCCENLFDFYVVDRMSGALSEATQSDAIAFARQMLPTIPALLPSLVADHVSVVQAIDRPQAQVYYMNIKAENGRGAVSTGQELIGAKVGHASSEAARLYASDHVINLSLGTGTGASGSQTVSGVLARKPVIGGTIKVGHTLGAVEITDGVDDAASPVATITGTNIAAGSTVNLTSGAYTINFTVAPDSGTAIYLLSYRYNVEKDTAGIGGLDLEVVSENVDAMVFPLRLNYTVFSAINLQKIHGMVLADEGMKFATQEIRFAIDQVVLKYAQAAATGAGSALPVGAFNASVGSGQEWIWRMHEFKRYISKASANIFAKTLRATGNVIVGGVNVTSLIEQLPDFKPAAGIGTKPPAGPYVFGTLGNRLVVCNPFFGANEYIVLFRGDNYLFAGLIFAPYVPLYSTDPITLADLTTQRGFMSQAAVKVINPGMFCSGSISGY